MPSDALPLRRVDIDEVEFDDQLALVEDQPFTGIIHQIDSAGCLRSESRYREGLPDGLSKEWYPDGQIEARWIAIRGNGSSESWEWHRNGQPRSYRRNVDGYATRIKAWDERGALISDETRPPLLAGRATPA